MIRRLKNYARHTQYTKYYDTQQSAKQLCMSKVAIKTIPTNGNYCKYLLWLLMLHFCCFCCYHFIVKWLKNSATDVSLESLQTALVFVSLLKFFVNCCLFDVIVIWQNCGLAFWSYSVVSMDTNSVLTNINNNKMHKYLTFLHCIVVLNSKVSQKTTNAHQSVLAVALPSHVDVYQEQHLLPHSVCCARHINDNKISWPAPLTIFQTCNPCFVAQNGQQLIV